MMSKIVKQCESHGTEAEQIASSAVVEAPSQADIVNTLRGEAKYRPTMWGDARPLLICAADEIERQAARIAELEDALRNVLPLAKAYATRLSFKSFSEINHHIDYADNVMCLALQPQPEGGA